MVNELEPDLLCFTGDMVHNFSEEVDPFIDILNELKAPLGKYAILGNHDYGAYFQWDSKEKEAANLERVKAQIRAAGFDLLLNEHRTIALNGDQPGNHWRGELGETSLSTIWRAGQGHVGC